MPRQSTGPRLWLDKKRQSWSIIDGRKSVRTGCSKGELQKAQEVLTAYIAKHHIVTPGKDPLLSDVLKVYAEEHISGVVSAASISYDPAFVRSIDEAAAKPPEFIGTADEVLDFLDIGRRKALSDFTRVVEETGILDQKSPRSMKP